MVSGGEAETASPVITGGGVDLDRRWVYGFGLGGVPVVFVTRNEIAFTSPTVDGSLDRRTGRATIAVRSADGGADPLMSMDLVCRLSAPPS